MKFSATDWSFQKECRDPERFFASLVQIGFDAIELIADATRRKAARDAGLKVLNMAAPGMNEGLNYQEIIPAILRAGYAGHWGFEFHPQKGQSLEELAQARALFLELSKEPSEKCED